MNNVKRVFKCLKFRSSRKLNIYLFGQIPTPVSAWSARINPKEREKQERQVRRSKKKGGKEQRAKSPTPTRAIDALIGDDEQSEKQKEEEKERNRERIPNPASLDH